MQLLPNFFRRHHPFVAVAQPSWHWLWPLLGIGFALRLVLAFNTNYILRPDEQVQYLEQAHRIVFGYGMVPWEYRVGARNWMISYPAIFALYLAKSLGLEQPWNYDLLVKTVYSLISMVLPWSMYHLVRRLSTEMAARAAVLLGLFWYELLAFAHRPLAEPLATAMIFAMLGLARADGSSLRLASCGWLLGLAVAVRVAYVPVCAFAGLVLLLSVPRKQQLALCSGGLLAVLMWGLLDKLIWGGWWVSFFNYTKYYAEASDASLRTLFPQAWGYSYYLPALFTVSGYLFLLTSVGALFRLHRHWFLVGLALCFLIPHAFYRISEYTNLFVATVTMLCLSAAVWGHRLSQVIHLKLLPLRHQAGVAFTTAIIVLGATGSNPFLKFFYSNEQLFFVDAGLNPAISYLSRLPDHEIKAVLLLCNSLVYSGGYYRLHKYVPVFETTGPAVSPVVLTASDRLISKTPEANVLQQQPPAGSGEPLAQIVSHIISCDNRHFKDFNVVAQSQGYRILVNRNLSQVRVVEPEFNYRLDEFNLVEKRLLARGEFSQKEVYLRKPTD